MLIMLINGNRVRTSFTALKIKTPDFPFAGKIGRLRFLIDNCRDLRSQCQGGAIVGQMGLSRENNTATGLGADVVRRLRDRRFCGLEAPSPL
ncbi:hypothetical protein Lpp123_05018 [Lacticaseibacillus paracasei subsp. paracasei Lpp123]|uniref:Uncharacterized protein n=1 Tax=Lacticaseibacillus paracasei subsp. paracasei Lpp123 TaxID=1256201 RepID=A0A829GI64_LACPA|nr:hypothetical protein Lpp123_05018 [Lacticaseibacillus paracasei subsp. paracasei Lpp123]